MGAPSPLSPVLNYGDVWEITAVFDVGATGAHTLKYGKGIPTVTRSAQGKFVANFTDVGGQLLSLTVAVKQAADTESLVARETVDSFSRSAKTAAFEVWEIDETAQQVDPPSGSDVVITARWLRTT